MTATPPARVHGLDVGVADIRRWRRSDEVHLPAEGAARSVFLPETPPLEAILRRETLDERLSGHLVPEALDPELLAPAVMAETRRAVAAKVALAACTGGAALEEAAALLEAEAALDDEVREALAALLRG